MDNTLEKILDLGLKISMEGNYHQLLSLIVEGSMDITGADGGTLYLLKDKELHFMILKNISMNIYQGFDGVEPNLPPVILDGKSICSYSAINKKVINIKDVYKDDSFNWDGPKKYDKITSYLTTSMVVIPLISKEDEVIGVLQLINAKSNEKTIPFSKEMEHIIASIASQASILLSNMLLTNEIEELLNSMVSSLTKAVDSRTPYNANHSKNVADLCLSFSKKYQKELGLLENDIQELYMASLLHDVGKMIIPLEVMNKSTRLGNLYNEMTIKHELMIEINKNDFLERKITKEVFVANKNKIEDGIRLTNIANTVGFLSDDMLYNLEEFKDFKIGEISFFSPQEYVDITIRKGTLSLEERKEIENHVVYSHDILEKIRFGKKYSHVLEIASKHHEYLDGSGYPNKIGNKDIEMPVRILTTMDVFESLTAKDRPYKKQMAIDKAYDIIKAMVNEGKLDEKVVSLFGNYLTEKGVLKC